ncbi:hypothetical protein HDV00_011471, partial [Rhizophlyctis rosea]
HFLRRTVTSAAEARIHVAQSWLWAAICTDLVQPAGNVSFPSLLTISPPIWNAQTSITKNTAKPINCTQNVQNFSHFKNPHPLSAIESPLAVHPDLAAAIAADERTSKLQWKCSARNNVLLFYYHIVTQEQATAERGIPQSVIAAVEGYFLQYNTPKPTFHQLDTNEQLEKKFPGVYLFRGDVENAPWNTNGTVVNAFYSL